MRRRFGLRTFFTHPGVPVDQGGTGSAPSEFGMGVHGGHGETSVMLHLRPELVRMERARANVPTALLEFRHIGFGKPVSFGWTSDDVGPDGHAGDPTGATAEHGKRFVESAVPHLAEVIVEAHRFRTASSGVVEATSVARYSRSAMPARQHRICRVRVRFPADAAQV